MLPLAFHGDICHVDLLYVVLVEKGNPMQRKDPVNDMPSKGWLMYVEAMI